ncbi:XFP-like protein [Sinorhizobium medicae]|uniref:Xylulose 5-phosphate/Fructose 6-phosphate phosphoketolase N-terminal domain-containing protein n=1 Tax=Sinorhizobium medicae TaxID=110321 RepID=A0A508WZP3_9HYPH|nr:XFP-like protein [Sinorhizobium medicae]TWA25274.1 XFP-like protein [Sinorhizobium medicae]TWA37160.1 XFP-like protein [Sinorhizobium medicae]TWA38881.1 XFP-like protein [Sinorhizobium medicae]TWA40433.1 XFP-like protein [Sinorhizobium medicae]
MVGDGEAETGPLATGWHGNKFLNPARDGCFLPILHLNGYKIANPCFLARVAKEELQKLFEGMGSARFSWKAMIPPAYIGNSRARSTQRLPMSDAFRPTPASTAI